MAFVLGRELVLSGEASSIGAVKALALRRVKRKAVDEMCIVVSVTDRQCEYWEGFHVVEYV